MTDALKSVKSDKNNKNNAFLPTNQAILVFLAFAFSYFMSALIRAITATISPTLTVELSLQARDLGLLSGGYFLGFAAMQLPLGKWLDRFGPKKVIICFLSVAVLGCLAFAKATSFSGLLLARVFCGAGVSACLMAPLTGYRRWLAPSSQIRANSWMLMSGSLGMVASTLPVQWMMPVWGWRGIFAALSAMTFIAMLAIMVLVPAWKLEASGTAVDKNKVIDNSYTPSVVKPLYSQFVTDGVFPLRWLGGGANAVGLAVDDQSRRLQRSGGGTGFVLYQRRDADCLLAVGQHQPVVVPEKDQLRPFDGARFTDQLFCIGYNYYSNTGI